MKSIRKKLSGYKQERHHMPFHHRLLGRDRIALYSFIHSLNTNFGPSIFEPVAAALAEQNAAIAVAKRSHKVSPQIGEKTQRCIQDIMDELNAGESLPNKMHEIDRIRKSVGASQHLNRIKHTKADIYLESKAGDRFLIDIKTAKPNKDGFKGLKRTLLEWTGAEMHTVPDVKIHSLIAIPYNPYYPKPYERWTMKGMLDLEEELKVGDAFWDFLAGESVYDQLLDAFEIAGKKLSTELDNYFSKF